MPQNKFALARYSIIDSMLRRNDYVKTSSIVKRCLESTGNRVSARTIQLDIEAMRYDPFIGYYAPICYCSRNKAYFYENKDYRLHPFSFTMDEVVALESLLKICETLERPKHYEILCRLIKKIKLYVN